MKNRKISFIKLGILLFGISLTIVSCENEVIEIETTNAEEINLKTVPLEQAKSFFTVNNKKLKAKRNYFSKGGNNPLELTPNWNTLTHQEIYKIENAQLTLTDVKVNRDGNFNSKLFFISKDNEIKNVIQTIYKDETDADSNIINGRIYFNKIDGTFIEGYRIENRKFTKKIIATNKPKVQEASFFFFFQEDDDQEDCWNTDTLGEFEGGQLDEVTITASGGGGGHSLSYIYSVISAYNSSTNYGSPEPSQTGGGGTTSVGGRIFVDIVDRNEDGTPVDEEEECPEGYIKSGTQCVCAEGYVKNSNNRCVKKPCKGNPIEGKLEVAPQKGKSKTKGALHGCTRYGGSCTGGTNGRNKTHAGIDIKSSYGNPIYAMYDGFIYSTKFHKKAGYNTRIQSTINGKTILVSFFHLQKENRVLQGTPLVKVEAGDIIGYQGDSGNLKGAIESGGVESHVHIEVREHDGSSKWGYKNFNLVDPRTYFSTIIKDDGTSENNTNCN